jgi:hypothetical protein
MSLHRQAQKGNYATKRKYVPGETKRLRHEKVPFASIPISSLEEMGKVEESSGDEPSESPDDLILESWYFDEKGR